MEIEDNLLAISNVIFRNRENWKFVTDEQKLKWFFIINRNLSKKFPEKAQLLNLKSIDKITAMNLWYQFMLNQPYPNWFWSKSDKGDKSEISDKDYKIILQRLKIKDIDLDYLIKNHINFIKEELIYIKKQINQN
jgi:hypothetical protein